MILRVGLDAKHLPALWGSPGQDDVRNAGRDQAGHVGGGVPASPSVVDDHAQAGRQFPVGTDVSLIISWSGASPADSSTGSSDNFAKRLLTLGTSR